MLPGIFLLCVIARGQQVPAGSAALLPDWRGIGNMGIDLALASPAGGPIDRVWFSSEGNSLFVRTHDGRVFESSDRQNWKPRTDIQAPPDDDGATELAASLAKPGEGVVRVRWTARETYAIGKDVYRSEDGGRTWSNLTRFRGESIIGEEMRDLAVSAADSNEVAVANRRGIWRSADGGLSWTGLNEGLPNLPVGKVLATPSGSNGTRVLLEDGGAAEWAPGEKAAWRLVDDAAAAKQESARKAASARLSADITAVAFGQLYSYAGARDGRLWVSMDQGLTWSLTRQAGRSPVLDIFVDAEDSRLALAAFGDSGEEGTASRLLRTVNGGLFWDELGATLPSGNVNAVVADRASGAVYAATDRGLFLTFADLTAAGPVAGWTAMTANLPQARSLDALLDSSGSQLFVALEGYGVYAAPAPHRFRNVRVVSAADYSERPAAPGSLLSVLGARLVRAQAGYVDVPVLYASDLETQIQVPFEASGTATLLAFETSAGRYSMNVALRSVSPAIFVDRDGTPLLIDGDSGALIDAMSPARSNGRVEILATGLGRVSPDWPTGAVAPLDSPPKVVAPIRVYLDRSPVEVTRAVLAPGYVGFYLIEIQLPSLVNAGPAELYVEAGGQESNRVRIYLEP